MTDTDSGLDSLLRYGKLAAAAPFRRGGSALPDATLQSQARARPEHLADYARVCGFDLTDTLPVTFPHVLAFGDTLRLLALPDFPFPAVGLVHVRNRIEQLRPIGRDEQLTLRTRFGALTEHHRGRQFDILVDALVDDTLVWRSSSGYLHLTRPGSSNGDRPEAPRAEPSPMRPTAHWELPSNVGRRYAAVAGDPNPIHLHPLGALLGGRRRPIAHGMWLLAHCVAALSDRLPPAYRLQVSFRRPVHLPGRVGFAARNVRDRTEDGGWVDGWDFQLVDPAAVGGGSADRGAGIRLVGDIRPISGLGPNGLGARLG